MNRMLFKDWLLYQFPVSEIIIGGSTPDGQSRPVVHPIGIAPQSWKGFDTDALKPQENLNEKLCYQNVNKVAWKGTPIRQKFLRNIDQHSFTTKTGRSIKNRFGVNFTTFFKGLVEHKFSISPEGNGIDCHRHYETILAKGIPIVNKPDEKYSNERWGTNSFMEKYDNLPILWTEDYTELSVEYLEKKYNDFLEMEFDFSKLSKSYWVQHSSNITENTEYWCNRFNVSV